MHSKDLEGPLHHCVCLEHNSSKFVEHQGRRLSLGGGGAQPSFILKWEEVLQPPGSYATGFSDNFFTTML